MTQALLVQGIRVGLPIQFTAEMKHSGIGCMDGWITCTWIERHLHKVLLFPIDRKFGRMQCSVWKCLLNPFISFYHYFFTTTLSNLCQLKTVCNQLPFSWEIKFHVKIRNVTSVVAKCLSVISGSTQKSDSAGSCLISYWQSSKWNAYLSCQKLPSFSASSAIHFTTHLHLHYSYIFYTSILCLNWLSFLLSIVLALCCQDIPAVSFYLHHAMLTQGKSERCTFPAQGFPGQVVER